MSAPIFLLHDLKHLDLKPLNVDIQSWPITKSSYCKKKILTENVCLMHMLMTATEKFMIR